MNHPFPRVSERVRAHSEAPQSTFFDPNHPQTEGNRDFGVPKTLELLRTLLAGTRRTMIRDPLGAAKQVIVYPGAHLLMLMLVRIAESDPHTSIADAYAVRFEGLDRVAHFTASSFCEIYGARREVAFKALRMCQRYRVIESFRVRRERLTIKYNLKTIDAFLYLGVVDGLMPINAALDEVGTLLRVMADDYKRFHLRAGPTNPRVRSNLAGKPKQTKAQTAETP